jgi:hypothetical protein
VETELRKIDPNIAIPYWDWSFDAAEPLKSPIFTDQYLYYRNGPNGMKPALLKSISDLEMTVFIRRLQNTLHLPDKPLFDQKLSDGGVHNFRK